MDFQRRIQEAQAYSDQTKASWDNSKRQALDAKNQYEQSFDNNKVFNDAYEQNRRRFLETDDLRNAKKEYEMSKTRADNIQTSIDDLDASITAQYAGTGMTEAQRQRLKEAQYNELNSQFTQYNADYETRFENYQQKVENAFNMAMDVANKEYDDHWQATRRKFDFWKQKQSSEEHWAQMYQGSQQQLENVRSQYDSWVREEGMRALMRKVEARITASVQRMAAIDTRLANQLYNIRRNSAPDRTREIRFAGIMRDKASMSGDSFAERMMSGYYW